jgi:preprotein translocase subunit SecG
VTIFLTVLHVLACLFLIVIVLLQRGKGAEMGAMFGGGAGATVFGSRGAGNFLTRMTTAAAVVFMLTSLTLAYVAQDRTGDTLFEEEAPAKAPDSTFGEAPAPPRCVRGGAGTGRSRRCRHRAVEEVPAPPAQEPSAAGQPAAPEEPR